MTRVLIVDDDPLLRLALAQGLRRFDLDVRVAETADEAVKHLCAEPIDVLVTDLRLGGEDGIEVLTRARQASPRTRTLLMSAYASARDYETALALGAVSVLCKPFSIAELHAAVRRAAETAAGFHGSFHGMSLVDLLQMLHLARRDTTIILDGGTMARIDMVRGDIVHAECGDRRGELAFREVMATQAGSFRTGALVPGAAHTIERSFDGLLLDTLRAMDESERDGRKRRSEMSLSQFPDDLFAAPTIELPRPSAVPVMDSVPASSSSLLRARAAWDTARQAMGSAATDVVATAFDLDGPSYEELVQHRDPEELARALAEVTATLRRVAGCEEFVACCVGDGFGIGVVSAPAQGYALGLTQTLSSSSSAMLFRSLVSTAARCVLTEG